MFAERWTPLILRELLRGSTTVNEVHRGVPRMSRSLLSNRLKKLEACGVLQRRLLGSATRYELGRVVTQLGTWAQRWYRSTFRGAGLDAGVLMWDIRCTVDASALPAPCTVVQFIFTDLAASSRSWWLVNEEGEVDPCPVDPGDEPALRIRTTLRTMSRVWMGDLAIGAAQRSGQLVVLGPGNIRRSVVGWLRLSPYAPIASANRAAPQPRRDGRAGTACPGRQIAGRLLNGGGSRRGPVGVVHA